MSYFEKKCKLVRIELETTGCNVICQTIRKVVWLRLTGLVLHQIRKYYL